MWVCVSWEANVSQERGSTQQERAQEQPNAEMINGERNIDNAEVESTSGILNSVLTAVSTW